MLPALLLATLPLPLAVAAPQCAVRPAAGGSSNCAQKRDAREPLHLPLKQRQGRPLNKRGLIPRQDADGGVPSDVGAWSDARGSWYYLTMEVGTPPQPIDVHIDTGSARLLVMSDACSPSECDHTTVFVSAESSSFTTDGESVIANFAGHSSYQGDWATDQVALGGWSLPEYEFGLVNRTVNETAAPSLLGLAWSDSTDTIKSVSYIWATDGTWADPQFGVYLTRPRYASAGSQINGSLLTFGGVATDAVVDGVINYTKTAVKDDWFVEINGLSMAGVDIDIDDKHVGAVDTGTTGIYMPNEVLDAIFANVEGAEYMPEIGRYSFPCSAPNLNLTFTLNGIDYPLYWGDLIWSSQGGRCYGNLYGNGHLTSNFQGNRWILGDAFMRNVYTAFRYKPAAIGFGVLKPEYNWQTNIVPGSYGNVEGEAPAGGGSGSRDSDDHFSTLSVTRTPGPTAAATVANGASTLNVWKAATAVTVLVSSFLAL